MWDWITNNSGGLNVIINIAICFIWLIYLQMLLSSHKRQRRSTIIISRINSANSGKTQCLLSNLSAETIHIHSIIAKLVTDNDDKIEAAITDTEDLGENKKTNRITLQGPLKTGDSFNIGSFDHFIEQCLKKSNKNENIKELKIVVVASYGADDLSVAAKRSFYIDKSNDNIIPCDVSTRQIRSRRERKELAKYLKKFYNAP